MDGRFGCRVLHSCGTPRYRRDAIRLGDKLVPYAGNSDALAAHEGFVAVFSHLGGGRESRQMEEPRFTHLRRLGEFTASRTGTQGGNAHTGFSQLFRYGLRE